MNVLAIDIGGTAIKIGLSDLKGNITHFTELPTESHKGGPYLVEKIIKFIQASSFSFDKIGISTAGQVDSNLGKVVYANENIPNYTGTNLRETFEKTFQVPVKVMNDVNAAALGEKHFGKGRKHSDFLCLTYGTGIGGAIVIKDEIYEGKDHIAGEIGHIILYPQGRKCNCGKRGCYERYASTSSLVQEAKEINEKYTNGKVVFQHLQEDKSLQQVYENWIQNLCYGLASIIHIFNPELILLGGGIMEQEKVIEDIRKKISNLIMPSFSKVEITQATLGNKAGLLGAVALHLK